MSMLLKVALGKKSNSVIKIHLAQFAKMHCMPVEAVPGRWTVTELFSYLFFYNQVKVVLEAAAPLAGVPGTEILALSRQGFVK